MLAMTSFAGCQKKEEEKKADTSKPEAIVEKYCDDLLANDLGDYEDYFSEDADTVEEEVVYTVVKNDDGEWRIKKIKD